jgi:hypothetical protein
MRYELSPKLIVQVKTSLLTSDVVNYITISMSRDFIGFLVLLL